jgi:hypothetical protein
MLAEMAEHDRQAREAVERPTEDDPQRVDARLCGVAPERRGQAVVEVWPDRVLRQQVGVKVDWDVERVGSLEDRPEALLIEISAGDVRIDHCAAQAELADRTPQLVGGGGGILRRNTREACETIGMDRDRLREAVVCEPCELRALGRLERLEVADRREQQ